MRMTAMTMMEEKQAMPVKNYFKKENQEIRYVQWMLHSACRPLIFWANALILISGSRTSADDDGAQVPA